MEAILPTLKTLQHKVPLEPWCHDMITRKGYLPYDCSKTIHNGMSCGQYRKYKIGAMFKNTLKIQLILLIPTLIANAKNLKADTAKTVRLIVRKWLKAFLSLFWLSTAPALMICFAPHWFGRVGKRSAALSFGIGTLGFMLDKTTKHP